MSPTERPNAPEFSPDSQRTQPAPDPIGPSSGSGCGWKVPGCVLGCGAVVGLVLLLVAGYFWWLLSPGEQHPTDAVAGPESSGAYQIRDLGEDEGARRALEEVVRQVQNRSPSGPEDAPTDWLPRDPATLAGAMARVMPREGTLAFERVPGSDEPATVLALNLRGFTRPLRMMLESSDNRTETYRGMPVVNTDGELLVAMADDTLVMSDHPGALRAAMDRLLDGTGQPVASRLELLEPSPESPPILSGGSSFEPGEISEMMRQDEEERGTAPPFDPDQVRGVERIELVVDDLDPEVIRFRVGVGATTPDQARQGAAVIDEMLRDALAADSGATYGAAVSTIGTTSVIDARLTGWIKPFAESIAGDPDETPPAASVKEPALE